MPASNSSGSRKRASFLPNSRGGVLEGAQLAAERYVGRVIQPGVAKHANSIMVQRRHDGGQAGGGDGPGEIDSGDFSDEIGPRNPGN